MTNSALTLRDMLMTISATTGNTKTRLFQSVDKSKMGTGFTLSFHPDKAAEAAMGIKGLYSRLLTSKHGKGINSFFTTDAIDSGTKMEWDPKTKTVTSQDDKELATILGMDDNMAVVSPKAVVNAEDELPTRLTTYQPERGDDDSVSTLGTKRSAKDSAPPSKKVCTHLSWDKVMADNDTASNTSSLTMGTMKTRISTIETHMTQVTSQMTQLGQMMGQLL
jgi:hypothetical protein